MTDKRTLFPFGANTPASIIKTLAEMKVKVYLSEEKIIACSVGALPERAKHLIRENRDELYQFLLVNEEYHGHPSDFMCLSHNVKLVKYRIANGSIWAGEVCQLCGQVIKRVRVKSVDLSNIPLMDRQSVLHRWEEKRQQYWKDYNEKKKQEFENEKQAWRLRYNQHLSSEKWKMIRIRILKRCNGICEGCGINKATQVHHLTYDRMGDEMLFDLAAMCGSCHQKVHGIF